MKILPYLLINLVMVGGGIVIYDQVRGEPPPRAEQAPGGIDAVDLAQLEARLLERMKRGDPILRAPAANNRLAARIPEVERKLGVDVAETPAPEAPAAEAPEPKAPSATPTAAGDTDEPSEQEVARFRRLMERAEQLRRDERERERLASFLERIEIELTPDQQEKLLASTRSYRTKMGERMRAAFQNGGGPEAAREAMEGLRQEFTVEIQEYLSVGDAQKITESASGLLRGWGGFRGRGRGGPRGPGGGGGGR